MGTQKNRLNKTPFKHPKHMLKISAGRYYRDTGILQDFISVIRIVILFGRITIFSSLFIVNICCWNLL